MRDSVTRTITIYDGMQFIEEQRELAEEVDYQIYINQERAGRIACSPWSVREALVGYLYMKGYISRYEEIKEISLSEEKKEAIIVTQEVADKPCEEIEIAPLQVSVDEILRLSDMLEHGSDIFQRTGGVHSAALARNGEFLVYKEDVSRHVAVDKVVGICLEQNIPMKNGILVFSGRVPAEILQKVATMGCGMIIARSAPTEYACRMAEKVGITLIAFARDRKFNIYTHPDKVRR